MIELSNGGLLVEDSGDLPRFGDVELETLFADFETTSCDDDLDALNPWHHCWALGIAVAVQGSKNSWYVPIRHQNDVNVPLDDVIEWWADILTRAKRWVNHNVKYDAHVSANDLGVLPDGELFDTVTHAKIIDSDRQFKGGYGLDALSLVWLNEDISTYEKEIKRWLGKRKDYGVVPRRPMAEYACQDVITNKRLYRYIQQRRPPECDQVAQVETELTRILVEMERAGMTVDPVELKLREISVIERMIDIDATLTTLLGHHINPGSTDDVYDTLCNQYGLPVLHWTDEDDEGNPAGNPSFDKFAMKKYMAHPLAPHKIVELIAEYRKLSTHRSLFLEKYQELASQSPVTGEWALHGSYNQCLRTGRMGCQKPNAQQLDKQTKALIHPRKDCAFISADQSQIEFRIIVHYINDEVCIRAYNENPDTDFHQWVADIAGMKRKPAKTMNFMMGYGGGKKKAVRTLSVDTDVVGGLIGQVDQMISAREIRKEDAKKVFDEMCKLKAERVYDEYHRTLPTLKSTGRRASAACCEKGFVFNGAGRRRHLPPQFAHIAFNSLCQSYAADIQKERTVALYRALRGTPIEMVANVHDETLLQGPVELMEDRRTQVAVAWILEHTKYKLRVPLRVSLGCSRENWKLASLDRKDGGMSEALHYTAEERSWLESTDEEMLFDWIK